MKKGSQVDICLKLNIFRRFSITENNWFVDWSWLQNVYPIQIFDIFVHFQRSNPSSHFSPSLPYSNTYTCLEILQWSQKTTFFRTCVKYSWEKSALTSYLYHSSWSSLVVCVLIVRIFSENFRQRVKFDRILGQCVYIGKNVTKVFTFGNPLTSRSPN